MTARVSGRPRRVGAAIACAVTASLAGGAARAALPSDPAGVPFATFAHATATGDYTLACDQLSQAALLDRVAPAAPTVQAARSACSRALGAEAQALDQAERDSIASTRVVAVRVKPGRARVTVQTTLFGIQPRSTGTAIVERGQWKIAKPPSGAHVGSSLVEKIPSEGMVPTLRPGDWILVDRAAYRNKRPRVGDVVVFHPPAGSERERPCGVRPPAGQACATATRRHLKNINFVKRIVAGPGDRLSIRHGRVVRNGRLAREAFITPCRLADDCDFPRSFRITAGRYYLLGDHCGASDDSRHWGPIPSAQIIGRVTRIGPERADSMTEAR